MLSTAHSVPGVEVAEQAISRIKVMSELDIAERRVPQDGRFKARRDGRDIDFRVSVMPSALGEDAVLRILDRRALSDQLSGLSLDSLGFESVLKAKLRELAGQPYGMMLATGPTGSGKTTTLYALISETNNGDDKFVTIEDPVEYQLPGVLQIPVNEQKGLTFARGLRSILRHDPDRIMVGEIRDPETAEIAVQSALTGHLVYTTVHANNAIDVLGRFRHMGVDAYNLVSALNGVLAQRLVRVFCTSCQRPGLLRLPGHRLPRTQGDRRAAGAERRPARADRRARAGAAAQGGGARRGHRPAARGRHAAGASRRNHTRGDQPCHFCGVARRPASAFAPTASWYPAARQSPFPRAKRRWKSLSAVLSLKKEHQVSIVLADSFVKYMLLPWNAALKSEEQWLALARHRMATVYGAQASEWEVKLTATAPQGARLACAIERSLVAAIAERCVAARVDLVSVKPFLVAGFNRITDRSATCSASARAGWWSRSRGA